MPLSKKVLYISPNAFLGGAEKVCEILLKYHDRTRYEPSIAFLRAGPLVEKFKKDLQVPVFLLPQVRMRSIRKHPFLISKIAEIIKESNIDLVHGCMSYAHYFGGQAASQTGIKSVWFQHGPLTWYDRWVSLIPTERIIANSNYTANQQKKTMLRQMPMSVVPLGADMKSLNENEKNGSRLFFRRKFGFDDQNIVVGTAGRIQKSKGQLEFLKIFADAYQKNSNIRAIIAGSSELGSNSYEKSLHGFVESMGLSGKVIFTGFIDDMIELLQCCDIFVNSSVIPEGFGLTVIEAMSQSLPVLASGLGGGPDEIITDGENGYLIDPFDTAASAKLINRLATDKTLRKSIGEKGQILFNQLYLPRDFTRRVESIYDEVLQK